MSTELDYPVRIISPSTGELLSLDSPTADQFAQVARGQCVTPTAVMHHPTSATVGAVVSGIQRAGRRPVLLAQDSSALIPYGGGPRQVLNLLTTQDAHDLTTPPISRSKVVLPPPELPMTATTLPRGNSSDTSVRMARFRS